MEHPEQKDPGMAANALMFVDHFHGNAPFRLLKPHTFGSVSQ